MIHAILILLALIAAVVLFGRRKVQGVLWQWCSAMLGVIVIFYLIIGAAYFTGISVWSAFWAVCAVLLVLIVISAFFDKADLPRNG